MSAYNTGTGAFNLTAFTTPTPVVYTNDQIANQLTNGYWGGGSHHFAVSPGGSLTFNVQALTAPGQNAGARRAGALDRRDGDQVQRSHHRRPDRL